MSKIKLNNLNFKLEAFTLYGYFIAKNFFKSKIVNKAKENLLKNLYKILSHKYRKKINKKNFQKYFGKLIKDDPKFYALTIRMVRNTPDLYNLCTSDKVRKVFSKINKTYAMTANGGPNLHIIGSNFVPKGGYNSLSSHQDWRYSQNSLDGLNMWIPLTNVKSDGYPLEVVPGSHKSFKKHILKNNLWQIEDHKAFKNKFVPLKIGVGDVIFYSAFLIHRTGKSISKNKFRIAMNFGYTNFANNEFIKRGFLMPNTGKPKTVLLNPNKYMKNE